MQGESRKGKIIFAAVLILLCAVISGITGARQAMEWVANNLGVRVTSGRDAVDMAKKNGYRFENFGN